jgi:excinuclease ABC subunit B
MSFARGNFRVRGDNLEIFPSHYEDMAWRVGFFGDEIEEIVEFDPLTGKKAGSLESIKIYANSHYVTPGSDSQAGDGGDPPRADRAVEGIALRRADCWKPRGSSSEPISTWR